MSDDLKQRCDELEARIAALEERLKRIIEFGAEVPMLGREAIRCRGLSLDG